MANDLLQHFTTPQLSVEKRIAAGKALRNKHRRISMGSYKTPAKRTDPVSLLEKQAKSRLAELVPIRHARMLTSPFAFFRGGAAIMAADLAVTSKDTGLMVQTCGDLHIANFGVFASAERNLVFGINDFDETQPGPWEWDLKRLVASMVAAGRYLGADKTLCEEAVRALVRSYRKRMRQFAPMGNLELWYSTMKDKDILETLPSSVQQDALKVIGKAKVRTHLQVLGKMTDLVDQQYLLKENSPFVVRATHTVTGTPIREAIGNFLASYVPSLADDRKHLLKRYRIVDVARKVVGVGSVGTRCWIIFMQGNHADDPLFLQIKQAEKSVLAPFVPKSAYTNEGQRVVSGQRLIQGAPDIFLGWGEIEGMHFYVRQLRDMKGGVAFDPASVKVENMPQYGRLCGWAMALAHAKSGDAALLSGYLGNSEELDDAMVKFAFAYAEQNEKDYDQFVKAIKSNRIHASIAEDSGR
jgi:uncharacterized protein (DUF2252 family)